MSKEAGAWFGTQTGPDPSRIRAHGWAVEPKGDRTMSRTWKTDPFWVKIVKTRGYIAEHDHRDGVCNLTEPPSYKTLDSVYRQGECRWTWSNEFIYSGLAHCGCQMCQGNEWIRAENRSDRYASKRELRRYIESEED